MAAVRSLIFIFKSKTMNAELIEVISTTTNRAVSQTKFLLDILENDVDTLLEIETRIKNLHISYCPGTREECEHILTLTLPIKLIWEKPIIIIYKSKSKIKWLEKKWNSIHKSIKSLFNIRRKTRSYRIYTT